MNTLTSQKNVRIYVVMRKISAKLADTASTGVFLLMLTSCTTMPVDHRASTIPNPPAVKCSTPQETTTRVSTIDTDTNQCPPIEIPSCPVCIPSDFAKKLIIGETEHVIIEPEGFRYQARIDTGASLTTLHATDLTYLERNGERWIRFQIDHPQTDDSVTLEKPVVRKVVIRDVKSSESLARDAADRRPVIKLTIALGPLRRLVEVTLTDRSHMEYPVLLGRNFLLNSAIVDVSRRNSGHRLLATQNGKP